MSEFKLCPCCGGKAVKVVENLDERFGYANKIKIMCEKCGLNISRMGDTSKGGYADNSRVEANVIKAWNRRV